MDAGPKTTLDPTTTSSSGRRRRGTRSATNPRHEGYADEPRSWPALLIDPQVLPRVGRVGVGFYGSRSWWGEPAISQERRPTLCCCASFAPQRHACSLPTSHVHGRGNGPDENVEAGRLLPGMHHGLRELVAAEPTLPRRGKDCFGAIRTDLRRLSLATPSRLNGRGLRDSRRLGDAAFHSGDGHFTAPLLLCFRHAGQMFENIIPIFAVRTVPDGFFNRYMTRPAMRATAMPTPHPALTWSTALMIAEPR